MARGNVIEAKFAGEASGFNKVARQVADEADKAGSKITGAFDKAGKAAGDSESQFMGAADVLDGLGGAFGIPTEGATNMMRSFGDLSGGFESLQPMIGGAMNAFKSFGMSMLTNPIFLVVAGITALAAGLYLAYTKSETFRDVVQGALSVVSGAFQWLWGVAQGVFGWVRDNWQTIGMILVGPIGVAVKLISGHWDTIIGGVRWVGGVIGSVFSGVWDTVKGIFNRIAGAWNSTIGKLSFSIPDIPGVPGRGSRFDLPDIPVLHDGGTFTAPGGAREGLALLETGETVIPAGRGAASGTTVVFNGVLSTDRDAAEWIVRALRDHFGRGGGLDNGRGGRLAPS
jgi:phage-related protein